MSTPGGDVTLRDEVRRAFGAAGVPTSSGATMMTSDLSIDEELNLHSIGWEPVELVSGISLF